MSKQNGHKPTNLKRGDPLDLLDVLADDDQEIEDLMRPFYTQLAELAWQDARSTVEGLNAAFNLENPYVQEFIDERAKLIRGVAETTRNEIRDLLRLQASLGASIEQVAQAILDEGSVRSYARAEMIARTETAAGYTQGSIAAYKASGVVVEVEWLMGPDSCDICQGLDQTRVALGAEFAPGVTGPPAHPNCTCALSPIVQRD